MATKPEAYNARKNNKMTDQARLLALKSLAYISQSENDMARFIAETGLEGTDVMQLVDKPAFLSGVLDFLMRDESLLLSFCAHEALEPPAVEAARHELGGYDA